MVATALSGNAAAAAAAEDAKWQRRVLPLSEYAAEVHAGINKKKLGIPVPLFAGETEDEYEQAFFAPLAAPHRKRAVNGSRDNGMLTLRKHSAQRRAKWCGRRRDQQENGVNADDLESVCVETLPREALYDVRYVERRPYKIQLRAGFFDRLKTVSRTEIYALFGNVVPPIYMPLTIDEMPEQCEERFAVWLHETKNVTLQELENHADPLVERRCRIEFAAQTVYIKDKKIKRQRDPLDTFVLEKKKPKTCGQAASERCDCPGHESVTDCIACSCQKCLARGIGLLKEKALRQKLMFRGSSSPPSVAISTAALESQNYHVRTQRFKPAADDIEAQLVREYEAINDQVVLNEKVLEECAARLAVAPVVNFHETFQLLAENEELSELIEAEIDNRNAALALLVVYLWRENVDELLTMVKDPTATNALHIHRASHHKCAELASEIKKKKDQLKAKFQSKDSTVSVEEIKSLSIMTDNQLTPLHNLRRREFVRLIRFDERLRLLIQEVLQRL